MSSEAEESAQAVERDNAEDLRTLSPLSGPSSGRSRKEEVEGCLNL